MTKLLYGYRIVDGNAQIDEIEAEKVEELFNSYIEGLTLTDSAKKAGLDIFHGTAGKMLSNARYTGDDFYPAIINKKQFKKANAIRLSRAKKLGRIFEPKDKPKPILCTKFEVMEILPKYADPFMQAEYAYSQIKCEV